MDRFIPNLSQALKGCISPMNIAQAVDRLSGNDQHAEMPSHLILFLGHASKIESEKIKELFNAVLKHFRIDPLIIELSRSYMNVSDDPDIWNKLSNWTPENKIDILLPDKFPDVTPDAIREKCNYCLAIHDQDMFVDILFQPMQSLTTYLEHLALSFLPLPEKVRENIYYDNRMDNSWASQLELWVANQLKFKNISELLISNSCSPNFRFLCCTYNAPLEFDPNDFQMMKKFEEARRKEGFT
ncbi:hypothetical protein [Terasakiella pusilla]|uniref:hypothetical protein n=1 Tax=Terasakiella pusilla TaxID=64973 RepID=UPI003AA7E788